MGPNIDIVSFYIDSIAPYAVISAGYGGQGDTVASISKDQALSFGIDLIAWAVS